MEIAGRGRVGRESRLIVTTRLPYTGSQILEIFPAEYKKIPDDALSFKF